MAQEGEICCHGTPRLGLSVHKRDLNRADRRLLIGATSVNKKSSLKAEVCKEAFLCEILTSTGTRAPGWITTGGAANLSIEARGTTIGVSGTQTKDDGRLLKVKMFQDCDKTMALRVLNHPCRLEFSLCTGISQRLPPARRMDSDTIDRDQHSRTIPRRIWEWLSKLMALQTEVVQKVTVPLLLAIEYARVERGGHTLTVWWPEKHEVTGRGLQIKKEQYSGEGTWIPMFHGPENSVIFGVATPRCLEHRGVKTCQNTTAPAKREAVKEVMLDTSLVPVSSLINAGPLSYELNKRSVLWCVTRASEAADDVVRLNCAPGTPYVVMQKLTEKWEKVKEKETLGEWGQHVLVL